MLIPAGYGVSSFPPVLTLYSLWVSIRSLFSGAGSSTIGSLLGGYWTLYVFSIIPCGIVAWAGKKIREWSDLRYSLKQTNSVLFTYLAREGNKTASVLITLIFFPLVFPFAALFAWLKAGISPPDTVYPECREMMRWLYLRFSGKIKPLMRVRIRV